MKISEFIKKLQSFKKEYGDLEVYATEFDSGGYYSGTHKIKGSDDFIVLEQNCSKENICCLNCLE